MRSGESSIEQRPDTRILRCPKDFRRNEGMRRRRVSEEERSCREGMETIPKDQTSRLNLQVNTHSLRMCVKVKGSPVLEFASQYYENTESISLMETIPKGQRSRLNLEVSTHFIHSQRNSVRLKGSHSKHKINFKRFISVQFWQSSPPPFFLQATNGHREN